MGSSFKSAALVAAGVFGYTWFAQWPGALRALLVAGGLVAGALVFFTSHKGEETREFLSEARFELRKVVWPTRQEAIQTTLIVLAVTAVMGLLLFILDGALVWLVNLITGV